MGQKSAGSQTVTNTPDALTQQYRQQIFNKASDVASQPYSSYQGRRVAGADPLSGQGVAGMQNAQSQYGDIFRQAQNFGLPNMSFGSGLSQGGGFNTSPYSQAGATGAAALGGDQSAISRLMDPYQKNVIGALGNEYNRARDKSVLDTNDIATRGGAFGGDRQALMQGERLGALDRGQMSDTANLLSGGYQNMMSNANNAANLGLGGGQLSNQYHLGVGDQTLRGQGLGADYALGQGQQRLGALGQASNAAAGQANAGQNLFNAGDYLRGIDQQGLDSLLSQFNEKRGWGANQLDILKSGLSGMPTGSTQSQPLTRSGGAGILGGAATGAGIGKMFGPMGAGLGAGLGGLFGLFG